VSTLNVGTIDSVNGVAIKSQAVNAQTGTTYTFVGADAGKLVSASNASAVTFTIPPQSSVTWGANAVIKVVNYGAGALTVAGGSGVTVTNTATTLAQFESAAAIRTGSDAWTLVPFSGAGNADFSDAATGTYTDGGIDYKYITFNASGTLTVTKAGFADVLVVGGAGSGGAGFGGGGGAGAHLYRTNVYLRDGSLTITVGAGGAARTKSAGGAGFVGQSGIASSIDGTYFAPGGGGGGSYSFNQNASTSHSNSGQNGGSGGGEGFGGTQDGAGGGGISGLGNAGGESNANGAAGGGGAGGTGGDPVPSAVGGAGGAGTANSITGTSVTRAGGGGGFASATGGAGGSGGGGAGGGTGGNGTANTGGGGGGGDPTGGNGGSGVVIVRVKV